MPATGGSPKKMTEKEAKEYKDLMEEKERLFKQPGFFTWLLYFHYELKRTDRDLVDKERHENIRSQEQ